MNWYEETMMAQLIAAEKIAPRKHKEFKARNRISTTTLRPLLRALLSWLF